MTDISALEKIDAYKFITNIRKYDYDRKQYIYNENIKNNFSYTKLIVDNFIPKTYLNQYKQLTTLYFNYNDYQFHLNDDFLEFLINKSLITKLTLSLNYKDYTLSEFNIKCMKNITNLSIYKYISGNELFLLCIHIKALEKFRVSLHHSENDIYDTNTMFNKYLSIIKPTLTLLVMLHSTININYYGLNNTSHNLPKLSIIFSHTNNINCPVTVDNIIELFQITNLYELSLITFNNDECDGELKIRDFLTNHNIINLRKLIFYNTSIIINYDFWITLINACPNLNEFIFDEEQDIYLKNNIKYYLTTNLKIN